MHVDISRGTFNDVIRNSPPRMAAIARRLRRLIVDIYPDVIEVPRPAEQHSNYGVGAKKDNEIFGYICPITDYVRLGFYYGGALPDPKGLLQGEGKRLRHIKIYSLAEVDRPEIRRLLKAAVQERKKALGLR
jgi:hypothetical protein